MVILRRPPQMEAPLPLLISNPLRCQMKSCDSAKDPCPRSLLFCRAWWLLEPSLHCGGRRWKRDQYGKTTWEFHNIIIYIYIYNIYIYVIRKKGTAFSNEGSHCSESPQCGILPPQLAWQVIGNSFHVVSGGESNVGNWWMLRFLLSFRTSLQLQPVSLTSGNLT